MVMTYFKKTSSEMKKDMDNLIKQINSSTNQNQQTESLILSRYDSILSLLQITQIHISNFNKQKQCATTENAEDSAKNEATAAEETTHI
jgi:hypothetical protein